MRAQRKKVLISGAGIAGPTLAWWLHRFGFEPSIIEMAPRFRTSGYMIDFWGKGFDLIDQMGLLPEVDRAGYHVREVRFVRSDGTRAGGFSTEAFRRVTGGRFISLPRGALARIIWASLPGGISTRFGDEIVSMRPAGEGVHVKFARSAPATFDLAVGADGLHSRVRELLFGPEFRFERFLGYAFAAFTVEGYQPRTSDVYMMYGVPGCQAARFAMHGDRTLIMFLWRADDSQLPTNDSARRAMLRKRFGKLGWECPRMLDALGNTTDLYVDAVSQIHLPRWSAGRVALVGDAAWAPSFLAGEGCGLSIIGAYALAGELARSGGAPEAFVAYEQRVRKFMEGKQKMASRFGGAFVPRTRFGLTLRNWIASLLDLQPIATLALASGLKDDIELPDYETEIDAAVPRLRRAHVA